MTKEKFLAYSANKEQFITLLCLLANRANIETHVAESDCDTQKSFGTRFKTLSVDVIAEDSEILIMLIHHITNSPTEIKICTKVGSYNIREIRGFLYTSLLAVIQ